MQFKLDCPRIFMIYLKLNGKSAKYLKTTNKLRKLRDMQQLVEY